MLPASRPLDPIHRVLRRAVRVALAAACVALPALAFVDAAHAGDARFDEGLLWRIERPGVAPSHVFGTIHVSDPRVTRLAPGVSQAIAGSRVVATEVVFDQPTIRRALERLYLPRDASLRDVLGEADFARLAAALARHGYPESTAERLTPFGAITFLTVRPNASVGTLDLRVIEAAVRRAVRTAGLESADEQFDAVETLTQASLVAELRTMLGATEVFEAFVEGLVSHYREERIGDLVALARRPATAVASARPAAVTDVRAAAAADLGSAATSLGGDPIFDRRSRVMVERMLPMVEHGGAFVAVGAAHLAGERGILALLEAAGWTVSRVPLAGTGLAAAATFVLPPINQ